MMHLSITYLSKMLSETKIRIFSKHTQKHSITLIFASSPLITLISQIGFSDLDLLLLGFSSSESEPAFSTGDFWTKMNYANLKICNIHFKLSFHII